MSMLPTFRSILASAGKQYHDLFHFSICKASKSLFVVLGDPGPNGRWKYDKFGFMGKTELKGLSHEKDFKTFYKNLQN